MKQSKQQQKELAKTLYVKNGYTYIQIMEVLSVSKSTVVRWSKDGNWIKAKALEVISKPNTLERFYEQINELNDTIQLREKGNRFSTPKEADTIVKLTSAIEKLQKETPLNVIFSVFGDAMRWYVENKGVDEAKSFIRYTSDYTNSLLKEAGHDEFNLKSYEKR